MEKGNTSSWKFTGVKTDREDWIQGTNPALFGQGTGADGNPSGFKEKLRKYASDEWMPEISDNDGISDTFSLMMRSDGVPPGGGGGGGSTDGGDSGGGGSSGPVSVPHEYTIYTSYDKWEKQMHIHCGVPAWRDDSDVLHFGEIKDSDQGDWGRYFKDDPQKAQKLWKDTFNFFTYNPSSEGIDTFSWPFLYETKENDYNSKEPVYYGVLSSMQQGSEQVCEVLSYLLDDGLFYNYPYNRGLGYLFRKKPIPKLVFVFSNEYDNESHIRYSDTGYVLDWTGWHQYWNLTAKEVVTVPTLQDSLMNIMTTWIQ